VLVVQDPFTSYYDAQVVADFVRLVEKLGYQPVLLPFSPNGKAQHIKGFLTRFARTAQKTADFLNRVAQLGMPMVGVDPALVLCYRDEYNQVLGDKRGDFRVMLVHEWLPQALSATAAQEKAASRGICLATVPRSRRFPRPPGSGRIFSRVLARSWKTLAWAAAAWLVPTVMK
jgi:Fe-S oxidoreductase